MSRERWVPVASFDGLFKETHEVSSCGRVRKAATKTAIKPALGERGYLQVVLIRSKTRKTVKVHRLVMEAFVGPRPTAKTQINHKDGLKLNNNIRNLEFCSARNNIEHYLKSRRPAVRGRTTPPPSHLSSLLTAARVAKDMTQRQAGVAAGMSAACLSRLETESRSNINLRSLVGLCRALDICPSVLVAAAIKDMEQ